MKIQELEEAGKSFEEVVEETEDYITSQNTFFVLENLETLRKNGRLSKVKALVASALKIKPVMASTDEGTICQLDQARGMNKALVKMVEHIVEKTADSKDKILGIAHCNCASRAHLIKEALQERLGPKKNRRPGYRRSQQHVCQRWGDHRCGLSLFIEVFSRKGGCAIILYYGTKGDRS